VTSGISVTASALVSIVEDDESVRVATENLLRSLGWSVASFGSADAYLASDAVSRTGCLISDVTMSGMTGIEMHALLISQGRAPPTIFITGFPNPHDEAVVLANGAHAYLEKPVESHVILALVRKAIRPS
jgi:FixJ family two-component response regulator